MSSQEKLWFEIWGDMAHAATRAATDVGSTVFAAQVSMALMPLQMFLRR